MAVGALVALTIVLLAFLGLTRTRPGRDVPAFDPTTTTRGTTAPPGLPSITARRP